MEGFPELEVLFDAEAIRSRVVELAAKVESDYQGKPLHVVGILHGSFIFLADLVRHIRLPIITDFLRVSSYGRGTETTGEVRFESDLAWPAAGEHVLLVEDIVDTGITLESLLRILAERRPASVRICTLLTKPSRRQVHVPLDYVGFEVPDKFVVGYGLDSDGGRYRNLPYLGVVKPSG